MADVGFHRSDRAGNVRPGGKELRQRRRFHVILPRIATAVCLDVADRFRRNVGVFVRAVQRTTIGFGGWPCEGVRPGEADASNDAVNAIPGRNRVAQSLEHDGRCPLTDDRSVGGCIERPYFASLREGTKLVGGQHVADIARQINRPDDGDVEFMLGQRTHADRQRADARRFFRGHGITHAAKAKLAGDATGNDAPQRTQHMPRRQWWPRLFTKFTHPLVELCIVEGQSRRGRPLFRAVSQRPAMVKVRRVQVEAHSDQNPRALRTFAPAEPGVIEGLGDRLQHEQLLRQRLGNFVWRQAKTADFNVNRVDVRPRHFVVAPHFPRQRITTGPPPGRSRRDRTFAAQDEFLKGAERFDATEPCIHADDRNRFGLGGMPKPGAAGRRHVSPWHGGAALGHGTRETDCVGVVLFDQHVRIDSAKAERTDGSASRRVVMGAIPRLRVGLHAKGSGLQLTVPRRFPKVGRWRDLSIAHCEQRFDQPGRTGRRQQVPDVRLDRPDRALAGLPSRRSPQRA